MAALVAAALAQVGDRTAWLAAILADRYRRPGLVIALAALALALAGGIAAAGGALLAPLLSPNAKQLMLALALLLQGGGALFPAKLPDRLDRWRLGVSRPARWGCSSSPSETACSSSSSRSPRAARFPRSPRSARRSGR